MSTIYDFWGNPVEITRSYVAYRNRIVDIHLIHTFQAKGRKLLINTYKQNQMIPTMCIFFKDKEAAAEAYTEMKDILYPEKEQAVVSTLNSCDMMTYMLSIVAVPLAILAAVVAKGH